MEYSVLMSVYAKVAPEHFKTSVESMLDQTVPPAQFVLVCDGPLTPELDEVIEGFEDRLDVVRLAENVGPGCSRNRGLELCRCELVASMDSDDISLPDRFMLQERYMDEHPEVDILGGAIHEFNDEGTLSNICRYPATMHEVLRTMYKASPLAHPTVMFRSSFFKAGFRYSSKYHICEDVTMWYDAAAGGRVINNMTDVLLDFRRNPSVLRRRSREKAWSEFLAYNDGISRLYGRFSYKYIYSFMRMCFRLMPTSLVSLIYDSKLRRIFARHG